MIQMPSDTPYNRLLERFLAWVQQEEQIRAVILAGSRARVDRPADQWADMDLMLYAAPPLENYVEKIGWLEAIAPVWLALPSQTAGNDRELLVVFEGGYYTDFVFCPLESLDWLNQHAGEDALFQRGTRLLLDRDGRAAGIYRNAFTPPVQRIPSEKEFNLVFDSFWYLAVYIARQVRRGDLWLAKIRDANLKESLLRMLEWHAGVQSEWQEDTWHNGRFIGQWADKRAVQELELIFGGYGAEASRSSLAATMHLFRWTARETAAGLGYDYPAQTDERFTKLVEEALR